MEIWLLIAAVVSATRVESKTLRSRGLTCKKPPTYTEGTQFPVGYPARKEYSPGNLMYFRCFDGYTLIGSQIRVCDQDGSWSGIQTWCNRTSCPRSVIYKPEFGSLVGESFRIGSTIKFRCNSGYFMRGDSSILCQPNGTWSSSIPRCIIKCEITKCKEGMKCILDKVTKNPVCVCKGIYDCPFHFAPVCGSDKKTYNHKCLMDMMSCQTDQDIKLVSNGPCKSDGAAFTEKECTPCPKIRICKALYASGYAFLGKPKKPATKKGISAVTFEVEEAYKGSLRPGQTITVYIKKSGNKCSCVPKLPDAKVLVFGQYAPISKGHYVPFIDENTFLTKYYSPKQMNLCWLL